MNEKDITADLLVLCPTVAETMSAVVGVCMMCHDDIIVGWRLTSGKTSTKWQVAGHWLKALLPPRKCCIGTSSSDMV